jgi:hypothetical protein
MGGRSGGRHDLAAGLHAVAPDDLDEIERERPLDLRSIVLRADEQGGHGQCREDKSRQAFHAGILSQKKKKPRGRATTGLFQIVNS